MSTYDAIPRGRVAASLGSGVGVSEVVSWQVSRSLSGGGLPQQARAVSGSSVGSGSVTLVPDSPGESPWSVNATKPGEAVSIDAAADIGAPLSPVARMVSRGVSADGWLSPVRSLSIEDDVPRGDVLIPEDVGRDAIDACAAIHAAARAAGLRSTPLPAPGAGLRVSVPMVGSLWADVGPSYRAHPPGEPVRYVTVGGVAMVTDALVSPESVGFNPPLAPAVIDHPGPSGTLGVAATVAILPDAPVSGPGEVGVNVWSQDGITPHAEVTFGRHSADDYAAIVLRVRGLQRAAGEVPAPVGAPLRLVVTWEATDSVTWNGVWRVWVNGIEEITWTDAGSPTRYQDGWWSVDTWASAHGGVGALMVGDSLAPWDYGLLGSETAHIASSNSPLEAIAEPTSGDAWDVIQQVATATLGACWIDEEGRLVYRNRDQLRGDEPQYTIQALDHLEDVPWSISTDEVADRVTFTYRPPTVAIEPNDTLTVWESTETVRVAAGATVRLDRDINGAASGIAPWYRVGDTGTYPLTRMSRYAAWTAPPGEDGSEPPASALAVSAEMLTPTRIRITIRNTTGATLWLYSLIARARIHVQPGADITIARGLPEDKAQRPLPFNAGSWVQDDTTAQQIADWLESQTAMPLPTVPPVRVIPDASRRLGDVVRVRIGSIAGLDPVVFKAIITSIDNSQTADGLEQRLGLTILGVTFDDWQRWGEANGVTTFDQLEAALPHLTTFDDLDHWVTDFGGGL